MISNRFTFLKSFFVIFVFLLGLTSIKAEIKEVKVQPKLLKGLKWRSIGPAHFGGRVADVVGVPGDPNIIYVGHSTAGLYKSTNGGTTFKSVFNEGNTLSIGAIAISPKNQEVLYVGTGEGDPRNSTSFGDGVYKSVDGGRTWKHLGLKDSERISDIIIHPRDPNILYVAAMGHEWGPNKQRGVFCSQDGGLTWKKILYVNPTTGASGLCFDPKNPNIIYAGMYDYLRKPWHFRSGGPGSGLYRSSDGGETWIELTDPSLKNGLPGSKLLGRIGISTSPNNPQVVYAIIESQEKGQLWRSDDRGQSWKMVNAESKINNRPFYYSDICVDPKNEYRIYALSGNLWVSVDGGRNFKLSGNYWARFGDNHALWIDPLRPSRVLLGNDGGFFISHDRGKTWNFINNMPFAQAYHVGVDMAEPYHVMGGFQDHEIWIGPNEKWNQVGVKGGDWRRLRYMADGMYALADPRDPNIIYYNGHFGDITRVDLRTGEERYIQPYPVGPTGTPASTEKYRFNWNSPICISPHDPDVIYYGGNVLFKTKDGGYSWEKISPDLTTDDPQKMKLSGGITLDNTRAEYHCTILTITESPCKKGVIWVGTDDGNIQLTTDGGETWTNVSDRIPGLPSSAWVASVKASYKDPGTAYVAVDQHRLDDFNPYAFMTTDYGRTWTNISSGLRGCVHIIKEDPKEPNLLYAGTELGIFVSFDRGKNWTDLRLGLPPLPVRDLVVHPRDNDLIMATHARGFYILDDATPLQKLAEVKEKKVALFKPMPPVRYTPASDTSTLGDDVFVANNQPYGAIIYYYLREGVKEKEPVKIEILNSEGKVIQSFKNPLKPGINRVVWNLRENIMKNSSQGKPTPWYDSQRDGPRVLPGNYTVRLSAWDEVQEKSFKVRLDPRIKITNQELKVYYQAVKKLVRMQYQVGEALYKISKVRDQGAKLKKCLSDSELNKELLLLMEELSKIKNKLQPPRESPDNLNLRGKISWLLRQVRYYTGPPTQPQQEWIERLDNQVQKVMDELSEVLEHNIPLFNKKLREKEFPYIRVENIP